ncbi:hypothetical protein [Burkholderia stagnalis]|nr:hypothetical protein [Burkholderia stagnalis]
MQDIGLSVDVRFIVRNANRSVARSSAWHDKRRHHDQSGIAAAVRFA